MANTQTTEPKAGIKSTEFWATIGISGLPIADQLGWFNKMPVTEGGETALWASAGLIASIYVFSRAWVKVASVKYGAKNEITISEPTTNTNGSGIRTGNN